MHLEINPVASRRPNPRRHPRRQCFREAEHAYGKGSVCRVKTPFGHEAAASLRQVIEVALRQSAMWWKLRATTSLARLMRDTNRCDEARAMVSEIYDWFTEGFDTADLKDAKALLDELST